MEAVPVLVRKQEAKTRTTQGCPKRPVGRLAWSPFPLRAWLAARALRELDRTLWDEDDPRAFVERALQLTAGALGAEAAFLWRPGDAEGAGRALAACGPAVLDEGAREALIREALARHGAVSSLRGWDGAARCALAVAVRGAGGPHGVLVAVRPGGCPRPGYARTFLSNVARRLGYVLERWQAAEALERSRYYDPLTGLPNRRLLVHHLERRLEAKGAQGWVAFLEVEDFGEINDAWGYEAGDAVARELARRLRGERERGVWVARCGAGRFALVGPGVPDPDRLARTAARLERPVTLRDATIRPRLRAGVARFPLDGREPQRLLRRAGRALAEARARGARVLVYRSGVGAAHQERARVERLRAALKSGRGLEIVYQPIVDIMDGRTVYAEALARWRDPATGRPVPADRFVALAERYGLATALDRAVLARAAEAARRMWAALGERAPRVTVNVAPESLADDGFVAFAIEAVRGLPPHKRPVLELTERSLLDAGAVREALMRLHEVGLQVFVDDLGSGYASFAALALAEVDAFKVDRALTRAAAGDERARAVFRAALRLGRDLRLPVVVEGVEDEAQLAWLRGEGVRLAQGYHLGRPQPARRLIAALRARGPRAAATGATTGVLTLDTGYHPVWLDL